MRWEQGQESIDWVASALEVAFNTPKTVPRSGAQQELGIWSTLPGFSQLLNPCLPGREADLIGKVFMLKGEAAVPPTSR